MPRGKSKKKKQSNPILQDPIVNHNAPRLSRHVHVPRKNKKRKKQLSLPILEPPQLPQQTGYPSSFVSEQDISFNLFQDQLKALNLSIRMVQSDGNSLFRAISDQLTGDESNHHQFRQEIIEYIGQNKHEFAPFYVGDFDEYLTRMIFDGQYGGNMELTAAAKRYKMDIIIHNLQAPRFEILYQFGKPDRSIHLSYHNNKDYASVRSLDDMRSIKPAKLINLDGNSDQKQIDREQQRAEIAWCHNGGDLRDLTLNEEAVMARTGCYDIDKVRVALECANDEIETAVNDILSLNEENKATIQCPCGHQNQSEWSFCSECGWDLTYKPLPSQHRESEHEPDDDDEKRSLLKPKLNGNDSMKKSLCHCGSGKKYRKCCRKYERAKKKMVASPSIKDMEWICECTLINHNMNMNCSACGRSRKLGNEPTDFHKHLLDEYKASNSKRKSKKMKKGRYNGYDDRRLSEMDMTEELNKVIEELKDEIADFKGGKQEKVKLQRELDTLKEQRDGVMFHKQPKMDLFEEKEQEDTKKKYEKEMERLQKEIEELKIENQRLKKQRKERDDCKMTKDEGCVVCMDGRRLYAFIPCGHLCLCLKCKKLMENEEMRQKCPVCQKQYESFIRIYG